MITNCNRGGTVGAEDFFRATKQSAGPDAARQNNDILRAMGFAVPDGDLFVTDQGGKSVVPGSRIYGTGLYDIPPSVEDTNKSTYSDDDEPIAENEPTAALDALPVYQTTGHRDHYLDPLRNILYSGEYDWYCATVPTSGDDIISWKQSLRETISIPPKSFLLMINGVAYTGDPIAQTGFRLQIFDDGGGIFAYDFAVNNRLITGMSDSSQAQTGPYILPSPLCVVDPGGLNISITNVEASGTPGSTSLAAGAIRADVSMIFAVPRCK